MRKLILCDLPGLKCGLVILPDWDVWFSADISVDWLELRDFFLVIGTASSSSLVRSIMFRFFDEFDGMSLLCREKGEAWSLEKRYFISSLYYI